MVDRIQLILKVNNLTASRFADEIGVQRSSISHILSGRNMPSLDLIQKILKRFPEIDSEWLLNGKGTMMKNPAPDLFNMVETPPEPIQPVVEIQQEPVIPQVEIVEKIAEQEPREIFSQPEIQPIIREVVTPEIAEIPVKPVTPMSEPEKPKEIELKEEKPTEVRQDSTIEKIVIFYTNKTFREYFPE